MTTPTITAEATLRCGRCGAEKPQSAFAIDRRRKTRGYQNRCRECMAAYYQKKRDAIRARNIAYNQTHKEERSIKKKAIAQEHPAKVIARELVRNAKIPREPCEVCGATKNLHAHHDDYAKPLSVRWLCSKHHRVWHATNGPGRNENADLSGWTVDRARKTQ